MSDEHKIGQKERLGKPDVALNEYRNLSNADPMSEVRETLLNAFYGYPYELTPEERERQILTDGARANHGLMRMEIERKKAALLDMIYERPFPARISYIGDAKDVADRKITSGNKDPDKPRTRFEVSQILSEAFQRFVIRPWDKYSYDKELQIQDMLLFSRGIGVFRTNEVYPRYVPMERVKPNKGASFCPDEWEYYFEIEEFEASRLWRLACEDDAWDKEEIMRILSGHKSFSEWSKILAGGEGWTKLEMNGEFQSQLETVEVDLLAIHVKEWNGSITKRYLYPHGKTNKWLWTKKGAAKSMGQTICLHVDDIGHGKFYGTPSFAQKLFLQCKDYDLLMNSAKNAARVNSMLLLERRAETSRPVRAFRDNMIVEPGAMPVQQRMTLPVRESVDLASKIMSDLRTSIGSYQPAEAGRDTAYEARADMMAQERVSSVTMKRWNYSQTMELREIYRRLHEVADVSGSEPQDIALKKFIAFCEAGGLKAEHWSPENVIVESVVQIGAGEPGLRLERATKTLEVLRIKPNSPGERAAQRDAINALNGMMNGEDYMPEVRQFADDHTRVIGMENESMKDSNFKPHNAPVLAEDPHILHVLGDVNDGGQTLGHLPECAEEVGLGLQMMESFDKIPESEHAVVADKINSQILYVTNMLEHIVQHLGFIAGDRSVKTIYDEARMIMSQIVRQRDELAANFGRLQEARMKKMAESQGEAGNAKAQAEAMMAEIKIQKEKALADIKVAARVEETQARVDAIRAESAAKTEATGKESAVKLADKIATGVNSLAVGGGEGE